MVYCVCFNLYCGGFILFCNVCCICVGFVMFVCVWVCVGFVMCGCFGSMYTVFWLRSFLPWMRFFSPWLRFFHAFFLNCKANARIKLAKTGRGLHSSTLVAICVVLLLFVLFHVLFVCKWILPPGDNPIAVNKYIISRMMFGLGSNVILHIQTVSESRCNCLNT